MQAAAPLDEVLGQYVFYDLLGQEIVFKPVQVEAVNSLAPLPRAGWYCEVATGKTPMSTAAALYKRMQATVPPHVIVVMPPILIAQWHRWLTKRVVSRATGQGPSVAVYRGSPARRRRVDLNAEFVLMSMPIFRKDYDYLCQQFEGLPVVLIVDEATSVKNVGSQAYQCVRDFVAAENRELMLLTGTPLSNPGDAYAYVKSVAPTIYRNQRHFEALHVEERDFFDKVIKWSNLDLLHENMSVNSARLLTNDVWPDLELPLYDPKFYDLPDEHAALYKKLADEQILLTEEGGKFDATTPQRLYTMLQQIVCNPGHFSGDPNMRSAAYEMLDQLLDELCVGDIKNGRKLFIFAGYKMTNRGLLQYLAPYNAVGFYSDIPQGRQQENLRRFLDDERCRVAVGHWLSAGYGLDGLQAVCSDAFFMETPTVAKDFHQAVGRFTRPGQTRKPVIRIGIATGTVQVRLHRLLLEGDALVNKVQGGWKDLKEAIYGQS
jgi:SNF2 family DNA or RNA helicase